MILIELSVRAKTIMGNEAGYSSIGKCCSSEEIEEVIKRDGTQTLSFDNTATPETTE